MSWIQVVFIAAALLAVLDVLPRYIEPRVRLAGWYWRFIPRRIDGIVLWPFILMRSRMDDGANWLYVHEYEHVKQIERDGLVVFYFKYLYYQLRYGYEKNPYEVEAYRISGRGE